MSDGGFQFRRIDVTFIGPTTIKFSNLRCTARIRVGGSPGMGAAQIAIYGLTLSHICELSTFGRAIHIHYDYAVIVEAGYIDGPMFQVFQGTITQAWGDFQSMPDVPFYVVAQAGLINQVQTTSPNYNSYTGSTDVATIMQTLAGQMGLSFENKGVSAKVDSPYLFGAPRVRVRKLADMAGINWIIENNTLAIWPTNTARGDSGVTISPQTNLVSYPTFTEYGVLVKTRFEKPVRYGDNVTIKSDLQPACGSWSVRLLDYDLAARMPRGHWFLSLGCVEAGYGGPFVPG